MHNSSDIVRNIVITYGYWSLCIGLILETFLLTSFLVPGTVILIIGGYASAEGALSCPTAICVSLLGTLIGDNISFMVGRSKVGEYRLFNKYRNSANNLNLSQIWYRYLFHFTSITRAMFPFYLGLTKINICDWWKTNIIASLIFVAVFFGIGYGSFVLLKLVNMSLTIGDYVQYTFNIILMLIISKTFYNKFVSKS